MSEKPTPITTQHVTPPVPSAKGAKAPAKEMDMSALAPKNLAELREKYPEFEELMRKSIAEYTVREMKRSHDRSIRRQKEDRYRNT